MNQKSLPAFRLSLVLFVLSALAASSSGFAQDGIMGGEIRTRGSRDTIPVLPRSSNPATLKLLQSTFTIHGGYAVVDSMGEASFAISVEPLGGSGASLTISSGVPEKVLFSETLAGRSTRNAVFRAVDRAVFKTSGKPGFFAGKLAFIGEESGATEVYTSDLLFGDLVRVTSDNVSAVRPHWSPDGNYIVYTSYKSGFPDIHRLDMVNHRRDVVADFKGTNMGARYSPDGSRLAMIITGRGGADLWVRDATGRLSNLSRSNGLEAAPTWSPDGTRIAFSSDQNGGNQLFVVPSSGGGMRRLRTDISGYCAEPDWNPVDANKIAFTAAVSSGFQIAVYDLREGRSRFLTSENGDAIEASWLNDGRHIIYTHRRANNSQIRIMDTVTQKSYQLSGGRRSVSQASFLAPR